MATKYTFPYNGQTIVSRVSKSCYRKRILAGWDPQRAATEPATTVQQAGQKAAKVFGGNPYRRWAL